MPWAPEKTKYVELKDEAGNHATRLEIGKTFEFKAEISTGDARSFRLAVMTKQQFFSADLDVVKNAKFAPAHQDREGKHLIAKFCIEADDPQAREDSLWLGFTLEPDELDLDDPGLHQGYGERLVPLYPNYEHTHDVGPSVD